MSACIWFPNGCGRGFTTLSDLVVAAFGFGMARYGWQLAAKVVSGVIPGLGISRLWDFAPVIGGGVLLVLFSAERMRRAAGPENRAFRRYGRCGGRGSGRPCRRPCGRGHA